MTGRIAVVLMAIGLCAGAAAGDITVTGDVNPADPADWPTVGVTDIGETGVGSVTIDDDSDAVSRDARIAYNSGSSGDVTVRGAGSTWVNEAFWTGYYGSGTLDILDGGAVESEKAWINWGYLYSSIVTVDGPGSSWSISKYMNVGTVGSGTLRITNGGIVNGNSDWIGQDSHGTGVAVVDGPGSTWSSHEHRVGAEGHGTLEITNGGALTTTAGNGLYGSADIGMGPLSEGIVTISDPGSSWTCVGFYAGAFGNATLNINTGGAFSCTTGKIGYSLGSTGVVTISDAGSTWTNSDDLYVGYGSGAAMNIMDGGAADSSGAGYLGYQSGGMGAVTVDGAGSAWRNNGPLTVGYEGSGTLNISNGGLVAVDDAGMTIDYDGDGNAVVNMDAGGMLVLFGQADDSLGSFLSLIDGTDAIRYWDDSTDDWAAITSATSGLDYTLSYLTEGDLIGYTMLTVFPTATPLSGGDFDGDGDVDVDDIDALVAHLGDPAYDLDGDGDTDEDDLIYMIENLVEWSRPNGDSGVGTKRGDANLDGLVNATDLAIMKANFAQTGIGWSGANLNVDNVVNATDLAILKADFAFVAPTGAIPEPVSLSLLGAGALLLLGRRRRDWA